MMLNDDQPQMIDEVMAEVHRAKAELLNRFLGDLAAMARDAREREVLSGHPVVDRTAVRKD